MAATAYVIQHATSDGVLSDILGPSSVNQNFRSATAIFAAIRALSHVPGMLYRSSGAPTTSPSSPGAFCIDTTNHDVYVCTDRSTPTWTILQE